MANLERILSRKAEGEVSGVGECGQQEGLLVFGGPHPLLRFNDIPNSWCNISIDTL
jgi:hypothetical protein